MGKECNQSLCILYKILGVYCIICFGLWAKSGPLLIEDVTTAIQPHKSKHSSELNCYTKEHKLVGPHRAHVKFDIIREGKPIVVTRIHLNSGRSKSLIL